MADNEDQHLTYISNKNTVCKICFKSFQKIYIMPEEMWKKFTTKVTLYMQPASRKSRTTPMQKKSEQGWSSVTRTIKETLYR